MRFHLEMNEKRGLAVSTDAPHCCSILIRIDPSGR